MSRITSRVAQCIILFLLIQIVSGDTADDLIGKGHSYESAGRYDEALKLYNEAISLKPNESYVYLPKMDILEKLGQYGESNAVWKLVITNLPNSTEPIYYYVFVAGGSARCADYHSRGKDYLIYQENYNEALFYFNRVHELCPNDTDIGNVYADEGYAYYKLGRFDESIKAYELALNFSEEKLASNPQRNAYITNNLIFKSNIQIISNKMSGTPLTTITSQPSPTLSEPPSLATPNEDLNALTTPSKEMPFPWVFSFFGLIICSFLLISKRSKKGD